MKRTFVVVSVLCLGLGLGFGLFSLAQEAKSALFDTPRMERELDIMKGILQTTLDYALQDARSKSERPGPAHHMPEEFWGREGIGAYYLVGQGAVFTIAADSLYQRLGDRHGDLDMILAGEEGANEAEQAIAESSQELAELEAEQAMEQAAGEDEEETVSGEDAKDPVKMQKEAKARVKVEQEKIRQRMVKLQERMRKQREEAGQRRARFQETLARIKVQLVEALANHGDSMSQVQPDEYLTLIITPDGRALAKPLILSVKRSAVVDFKAGRLTLDAFRAKVLDYTN